MIRWVAFLLIVVSHSYAVDFEKEIAPILSKKCLGCHNPNIEKGGLSFDTREKVLESKTDLVVPGDALASELYLIATPADPGEKPEMPEEGEPLTKSEAELMAKWINEGADWPEGLVLREASKADKSWWAYRKLSKPAHSTIDAFIDEKLAEHGLERNAEAARRDLIRRATYDLTGLPPTAEEVRQFVETKDPKAYEKLIDRLLASPRYGERWGRHWLDVVRFGESNGFERNRIINELWPFRDYVIRSINEDKPFDQFIREHLAGDVFGKDDPYIAVGSAFLVAGPYDDVGNQDVEAKAQIRANTLDEIINATGEAFLGMTLGCARCHDHKFDPISQKDYYRMYATFAGVRHGPAVLATPEQRATHTEKLAPLKKAHGELTGKRKELEQVIQKRVDAAAAEYERKWTRPAVDRTGTEEKFAPTTAKLVRFTCEANDRNPATGAFRIDEFEIFSAGENPTNVALASNGAKASGPSREIEDFPGAYGPHLAIDGKTGARFIPASNYLTIELAKPTEIDRIIFSSAKGETVFSHNKFTFAADYRIEVSLDGEKWTEVANGRDRKAVSKAHRDWRIAKQETQPDEAKEIARLNKEIATLDAQMKQVPPLPAVWIGKRSAADAKGPFPLFIGGSPQRPGEHVVPASLSTLSEVTDAYRLPEDAPEDERRMQLANWITDPKNPITARVLANRLWHYHFGTGIVDTPNDFGYMGGRPTHPELLDFLAKKLQDNGWRLKPLHRMIMLSETYRQSSDFRSDAAAKDGDSRLLWRFPPRRLSAEEIRDTVLAVSGSLDLKMGGPGFRLYQYMSDNVSTYEPLDAHGPETYRRAVYHQNARASVVDLMTEFDQPDCALSTPRRARTTTPLQALTMMNHQFTIDMADALAARVGEGKPREQIDRLYAIVYQRPPTKDERKKLLEAIRDDGLRPLCRAILNSSELIYLD